jgi:hypothetical protein
VHALALHSDAFAVDDANDSIAFRAGFVQIGNHHVGNVARPEGVQVQHVGDV